MRNQSIESNKILSSTSKTKRLFEKAWRIFYLIVLGIAGLTFIIYFFASPSRITGSPTPPFKSGEFILSERLTYLFRQPNVGDRVLFKPNDSEIDFVGIITNVDRSGTITKYSIQSKLFDRPWIVSQDRIKKRIYYPLLPKPSPTPEVTPLPILDKVIFYSKKYVLAFGTSEGKNIQPFSSEITNNFKYIANVSVSPKHDKLIFTASNDLSEEGIKESRKIYFLASLDGEVLKKINTEQIKNTLGWQYDVAISGWSLDGEKIIIWARDIKNFVDNLCCEGGDYRTSKQLIGEYDIDTETINIVYTKVAPPLEIIFYDPTKKILAYEDFKEGKGYLADLASGNEIKFSPPNLYVYGGSGHYYVREDPKELLRIYSVYEPNKEIGQVKLKYGSYSNSVIWSPNNTYFAIKYVNFTDATKENSVNNATTGSGGNIRLLKIYNKNGNLVLSTVVDEFDEVLFSKDEKYVLLSKFYDKIQQTTWQAIEVTTGNKYVKQFISSEIGSPVFWGN